MLSNVITPMMKILVTRLTILTLLTIGLMPVSGNAQIDDLFNKTVKAITGSSDGEIDLGLKQALEFGVKEAVDKLSADKGYFDSPYKILVPEEARYIVSKVKMVPGFQDVEKQLLDKMNKACLLYTSRCV